MSRLDETKMSIQKITPHLWFEDNAEEAAKFYTSIFKFSPAISFLVSCETQQEIDIFWQKLSEGGGEQDQCGWLKDKFGVSWQIVPSILAEMIHDKDANKSERVIKAMLQMKKLDIQGLRKAYAQFDKRS